MDVPRPQRTLRERAHPRHPGKRGGCGPPSGIARPHGAGRPVRRASGPIAVEVVRRPRVDGRLASGRHPRQSRVRARPAAQATGVRKVRGFQTERGSATGKYLSAHNSCNICNKHVGCMRREVKHKSTNVFNVLR